MHLIIIILVLIIVFLATKLFLINNEIKNITKQLWRLYNNETQKKPTLSISNKNIEKLCVCVNRTMEKHEKLETNIRKHEEKLKQSIVNVSHDLRTPLTSMLGYVNMIKSKKDKQNEDYEYICIIENRANALNNLINEFFDLSVIDSDDYNIPLEKIDIVSVLTNNLMNSFNSFEEKSIVPSLEIPEKSIKIMGNEDAFNRIFQNLISNSLKYSCGEIEIIAKETDDNFIITFSNKADLLTEKDVLHLFDRFYKADVSRTKKSTGIGLYVIKILSEKMGHKVYATISENKILKITLELKTELA